MHLLAYSDCVGSRCAGVTAGLPPSSCSRCVIARFRKQPGCLRRIKMRRKKESVRPANGWFTRTQITITGWNQIIKRLVCGSPSLAGSGCPFQPEQLTAVSVDIFCVENETDLLGRRCAKFYDRKRPLKSCILWHAPRSHFCGVIQVSGRLAVRFAWDWLRRYGTTFMAQFAPWSF